MIYHRSFGTDCVEIPRECRGHDREQCDSTAAKVSIYGHTGCEETSYTVWWLYREEIIKRQTKRLWRLRGPARLGVNKPRYALNYEHSALCECIIYMYACVHICMRTWKITAPFTVFYISFECPLCILSRLFTSRRGRKKSRCKIYTNNKCIFASHSDVLDLYVFSNVVIVVYWASRFIAQNLEAILVTFARLLAITRTPTRTPVYIQ